MKLEKPKEVKKPTQENYCKMMPQKESEI